MATSLFEDPDVGRQVARRPESLEDRLRRLGLRDVDAVRTHSNRTVILSLRRRILRVHRGYESAPDDVLSAIVRFLTPRARRSTRQAAERIFLAFPVPEHAAPPPRRRPERAHPKDSAILARLSALHESLNRRHFAGSLASIPIRLSGRMRTRLGEITVDLAARAAIDIAVSRRHLRQDGWAEVEHTLLHEMVHQWQVETGAPLDHGPGFRAMAREVGVTPRARRRMERASA